MRNARFLTLAMPIFALAFGVQHILAVRSAPPEAPLPTPGAVDKSTDAAIEPGSFASDGDVVRDRLRYTVLEAAMEYSTRPCDVALKAVYIKAAINYARAWHRATGCASFTTCDAGSAQLDAAATAFHSPLDRRVREAMSRANAAGVLGYEDFPDGAGRMVALMAGAPLGHAAATRPPQCQTTTAQ